jgi:NTP pyrophosphatase (non-canonical NTP hydrolase)
VFGEAKVKDSAEVLDNWARLKVEKEGRRPKDSILDGVSRGLPPLDRAWKLQKRAARAGFDWPDLRGVIAKVREELAEVSEAAGGAPAAGGAAGGPGGAAGAGPGNAPEAAGRTDRAGGAAALEEELGDLLFSAVNLCRFLGVAPSVALQRANVKFAGRFGHVERRMRETGREMGKENLAAMDGFWEEAKAADRPGRGGRRPGKAGGGDGDGEGRRAGRGGGEGRQAGRGGRDGGPVPGARKGGSGAERDGRSGAPRKEGKTARDRGKGPSAEGGAAKKGLLSRIAGIFRKDGKR